MDSFLSAHTSYWEAESFLYPRNAIIIGGGIVGLCTAIELKKSRPGWSILVVDRTAIPLGASTRNAGFACFGSPSELLANIRSMGWDDTIELVRMRWEGLKMLRSLISERQMGLEAVGGFEVFRLEEAASYQDCEDQLQDLNQALDFTGKKVFGPATNQEIKAQGLKHFQQMIHCYQEAAIHTGQLMQSLTSLSRSLGIDILTGLRINHVESAKGQSVLTLENGYQLHSNLAVVATNAFATKLIPQIDVVPARNQVLITEPVPGLQLKGTFHCDEGYLYFRHVGNRVLLGGARNRFINVETTDAFGITDEVTNYLREFLSKHLLTGNHLRISHQWSGILGVGKSKQPLLQWYRPGIYLACRMGGMGISIGAAIAARAAKDIIEC